MAKVKYQGIQFDSIFEREIYKIVKDTPGWSYHTLKIPFTTTYNTLYGTSYKTEHTYSPDFILTIKGQPTVLYEAKGRFYTKENVQKTLMLSKLLNSDKYRYGMILQSDKTKVLGRKKMTIGQWCEKHDITYMTFDELGERYGK